MQDELVAMKAHPQHRGRLLVAMAVDVREQDRDLVHEAELPGRVVEDAAEPFPALANGDGTIAWRAATASSESSHPERRLEVERIDRCAPPDTALAGELASANMPATMGAIRAGKLPSLAATQGCAGVGPKVGVERRRHIRRRRGA